MDYKYYVLIGRFEDIQRAWVTRKDIGMKRDGDFVAITYIDHSYAGNFDIFREECQKYNVTYSWGYDTEAIAVRAAQAHLAL